MTATSRLPLYSTPDARAGRCSLGSSVTTPIVPAVRLMLTEAALDLCVPLQVHWQRMLADNTETFNTHRFEDAAVLAARASGDHEIEALICKGLAAAYSGLGLYDKMLEYEQQALSIAKETGDVEAECRAYCRLANIYRDMKQPAESVVCLENALAIAQRVGDGDTEHECFCTLSVHNSGFGNFEQAKFYGDKALQRATLQGNKEREGSACGCLGIAYSCKGDHVQAVKWHGKYLQASKDIGNKALEAQARGYLGGAHLSLDNLLSALDHFEQYLRLAKELEDFDMEGRALVCCARIHLRLRQSKMAVQEVLGALRLGKDMDSVALVEEVKEVLDPLRLLIVQEATEWTMQGGAMLEACVADIEMLLLIVQSVGSEEVIAGTLNLLITVYMTIGDNAKAMEHCNSALNNALANDDKVQIATHKQLKTLLEGGHAPLSPLSPAIKSWPAGPGNAVMVPSSLVLDTQVPALHRSPSSGAAVALPEPSQTGTNSGGAGRGWDKSFKAMTRDGIAEATAGKASVCGTAVLPTVATHVLGEMGGCPPGVGSDGVPMSPLAVSGTYVSKVVRLLKVTDAVKVGLKQTQLKLGRGWQEAGSSGKVWFIALDWVPKLYHAGSGGVVDISICNGPELLHSEVLADVQVAQIAQSVFAGQPPQDGSTDGSRGTSRSEQGGGIMGAAMEQALEIEVQIDLARSTAAFFLNGRKMGDTVLGISGEFVVAAQMCSLGDRVELIEPQHVPRSPNGRGGGMTVGRWSIQDRVRILRQKGNLAFKSSDFRHAVQVFSLALKLAPDSHVLFSNRSAAHLALGHFDRSLDDADSALKLNPDWPKGFLRKGDALKAAGRVREALLVYQQGLTVDSSCADLRDRVATAGALLESLEQAEVERKEEQAAREAEAVKQREYADAKARLAQQRYRERSNVKQARQRLQRRQVQASADDLALGASAGAGSGPGVVETDDALERRPRSLSLMETDKPSEAADAFNPTIHEGPGLTRRAGRSLSLAEASVDARHDDVMGSERDAAAVAAAAVAEVAADRQEHSSEKGRSDAAVAGQPEQRPSDTRPDGEWSLAGAGSSDAVGPVSPEAFDGAKGHWSKSRPAATQPAASGQRRRGRPQARSVSTSWPQLHAKDPAEGGGGSPMSFSGQPHPRMLAEFIDGVQGRSGANRWNSPSSAGPWGSTQSQGISSIGRHASGAGAPTAAPTGSTVQAAASSQQGSSGGSRLKAQQTEAEGQAGEKSASWIARPPAAAPSRALPLPRINSQEFPRIETVMPREEPSTPLPPPPSSKQPQLEILAQPEPLEAAAVATTSAPNSSKAAAGMREQDDDKTVSGGAHVASGQGVEEQLPAGRPLRRWKQRSLRWRQQLEQLAMLPAEQVRCVGELIFSADVSSNSTYHIDHGAKGTLVFVGLHKNGTECAIKRMQRLQTCRNVLQEEVAALNHAGLDRCPHVVAYEGDAQDENFEYLGLQLCECNLEEHVGRNGALSEEATRRFARDMLEGLAWLTREHQVHRDIKPRNLLLDLRGKLLLADFGLVREMGRDASSVHSGEAGTMGWMATEVLASFGSGDKGRWKAKSDVQVAGMVIFYMLTGGRHPFGDNAIATQFNILQGKPANIHLVKQLPLAHDLLEWMLASDVDRRPYAHEVLHAHPFFWTLPSGCIDAERCANFISKIAMTAACRHPDNHPEWQVCAVRKCKAVAPAARPAGARARDGLVAGAVILTCVGCAHAGAGARLLQGALSALRRLGRCGMLVLPCCAALPTTLLSWILLAWLVSELLRVPISCVKMLSHTHTLA